jgi:hypothetical protein
VHNDRGFARGIAARFPVDEVAVADLQQAVLVGFDFGI